MTTEVTFFSNCHFPLSSFIVKSWNKYTWYSNWFFTSYLNLDTKFRIGEITSWWKPPIEKRKRQVYWQKSRDMLLFEKQKEEENESSEKIWQANFKRDPLFQKALLQKYHGQTSRTVFTDYKVLHGWSSQHRSFLWCDDFLFVFGAGFADL